MVLYGLLANVGTYKLYIIYLKPVQSSERKHYIMQCKVLLSVSKLETKVIVINKKFNRNVQLCLNKPGDKGWWRHVLKYSLRKYFSCISKMVLFVCVHSVPKWLQFLVFSLKKYHNKSILIVALQQCRVHFYDMKRKYQDCCLQFTKIDWLDWLGFGIVNTA